MKVIKKERLIEDVAKEINNNIPDVKSVYNILESVIFNLIFSVDKNEDVCIKLVENIYNILEGVIFNHLSSVDENEDVCIKLFEGISLEGKYVPEKTKKNNLTGEIHFVESKIKPKFNITRSYCEKLNSKN